MHRFFFKKIIITSPESPPVARGGLCRPHYYTGASSGREGRLMPTSNCRCWHRVKYTDIDASLYISVFNSMPSSLAVGASLIFTRKKTSKLLLFKNLEASIKERETGFEPATLALARRCSTTEPLTHKAGDGNRTHVSSLEG